MIIIIILMVTFHDCFGNVIVTAHNKFSVTEHKKNH